MIAIQVQGASHPVNARTDSRPTQGPRIPRSQQFICLNRLRRTPSRADPVQEIVITTSFESLGLLPELLRAVAEQGYTETTPIQAQAIPVVLAGRDLLAAAQTGTGKTAGFTLPLLQRLAPMATKSFSPALHPVRCLILTPTRELAIQVHESVATYGKHLPLRSFCVYGGVNINPQIEALKKGVEILVATPGRLLDLVQQKAVQLGKVQILVLDEADRMLDMGFIPDIKRIIALLPKGTLRQTLLFSATFSDDIRRLSAQFLNDPSTVEVARRNTPAELVTQYAYHVEAGRKRELLAHLVKKNDWIQVLVFTKTKHGANRLATQLVRDGINADAIHGNKSQNARVRALEDFKEGKVKVLVATDIAARGLDIEELPHVVNFDLPHVPEDYVHRIGRTGRAGASGEALSLVCGEDRPLLGAIERLINKKIEMRTAEGFDVGRPGSASDVPTDEPRERGRRGSPRGGSRGGQQQPRVQEQRARAAQAQRAAAPQGEPRAAPAAQEPRSGAKSSQDKRGGGKPYGDSRPPRGRGEGKREERGPRYASSPAARTSGNSGGMDFNKPYEPSKPAASQAPAEQSGDNPPRKRGSGTTAVPVLFKRKAA
jgi:ATP-dependent RNA helicase RhlE